MEKYLNHTYLNLTDSETIRLLDSYSPALSKIPLSALIDVALSNGVSTFLALTDTPLAYTGHGLFGLRVNVGETALEFVALAVGDMTKAVYDTNDDGTVDAADVATSADGVAGNAVDVPAVGDDGKIMYYDHATGTFKWKVDAGGVTTFIGLTDTPAAYATHALEGLRVNAGATALEFIAITTADMTKAVYDTNDDGVVDAADLATDANGLKGFLADTPAVGDDGFVFYYDHATTSLKWKAGGGALPVHFGNTWYVDYNGPAVGADGSEWAPCLTIQAANLLATAGDCIVVASNGGAEVDAVALEFLAGMYYRFEGKFSATGITVTGGDPIFVEAPYLSLYAGIVAQPLCSVIGGAFLIFVNSTLSIDNSTVDPVGFRIPSSGSPAFVEFINCVVFGDADEILVNCQSAMGAVGVFGGATTLRPGAMGFSKASFATADNYAISMEAGSFFQTDAVIANESATLPTIILNNGSYGYVDGKVLNNAAGACIELVTDADVLSLGKSAWLTTAGSYSLVSTSAVAGTVISVSGAFSVTPPRMVSDCVLALLEGGYVYVPAVPHAVYVGIPGTVAVETAAGAVYMSIGGTNWELMP